MTHDQADALAIADRVVVMRKGRIAETGSSEGVLEPPAHLSVRHHLETLREAVR